MKDSVDSLSQLIRIKTVFKGWYLEKVMPTPQCTIRLNMVNTINST